MRDEESLNIIYPSVTSFPHPQHRFLTSVCDLYLCFLSSLSSSVTTNRLDILNHHKIGFEQLLNNYSFKKNIKRYLNFDTKISL